MKAFVRTFSFNKLPQRNIIKNHVRKLDAWEKHGKQRGEIMEQIKTPMKDRRGVWITLQERNVIRWDVWTTEDNQKKKGEE